ncbi:Alpha/Beta hydrolase protein [Aspergillus caelatus]|uniref:Alpha/Beta hydrolase protein n=1 Tax=Aspergillus caelatus TaxID=61420 RepID=A0A5N7AF98_9EURO|nr:Alpha/Beta hydrolase protein [Aspergillus caelatus]KAE8368343.1 Alpha/Beta hydrolase protein [Aspergillus caelatus]
MPVEVESGISENHVYIDPWPLKITIPANIQVVDRDTYLYVYEENVTVPLKHGGILRCNVYRPKDSDCTQRCLVLVICGPYGKDFPYKTFHPSSFSELNPEYQTEQSAWETPTPKYRISHGYAVSAATAEAFCDTIEWASQQPWSNGKVGLLGVSYYAISQWQVAARNPKGLAACVPWEGSSDSYNKSTRHGGILSNAFFNWWYPRQVLSNQYGRPGKTARGWGFDTLDVDLSKEELKANRSPVLESMHLQRFRGDEFFLSTAIDFDKIKVPILSVASLGGIMLHLRGNYLRFISGRHDLPFYYHEEVEDQRSFLDAFLKGQGRKGWLTKGTVPPVSLLLRKGNKGVNISKTGMTFKRRAENEWPLARTQYTKFFLTPDFELSFQDPGIKNAIDQLPPDVIQFRTQSFREETEITGHIVAHLNVSLGKDKEGNTPSDIDLFLSIRHISPTGEGINYTGSAGDFVPISKGWLRVSLRKTNPDHPSHRPWLPWRDFYRSDVQTVNPQKISPVDVEIWPMNVVVEAGGRLVLEISSRNTAGIGIWGHTDPNDRSPVTFKGVNHIHFGPKYINYVSLPVILSQ